MEAVGAAWTRPIQFTGTPVSLDKLTETVRDSRSDERTLTDQAYETLHHAILVGALKPGERLPVESLAEILAVSTTPIREALRQLHSVGLVEATAHRGARVALLSRADAKGAYDARMALEPLAIRRGAERFTDADCRRAHVALDRLDRAHRAGQVSEIWHSHAAFHFSLYDASGSRWLRRLIEPLWESTERYVFVLEPLWRSLDDDQPAHARMLAACARHDAAAAEHELREHLVGTADRIAEVMTAAAVLGGPLTRVGEEIVV